MPSFTLLPYWPSVSEDLLKWLTFTDFYWLSWDLLKFMLNINFTMYADSDELNDYERRTFRLPGDRSETNWPTMCRFSCFGWFHGSISVLFDETHAITVFDIVEIHCNYNHWNQVSLCHAKFTLCLGLRKSCSSSESSTRRSGSNFSLHNQSTFTSSATLDEVKPVKLQFSAPLFGPWLLFFNHCWTVAAWSGILSLNFTASFPVIKHRNDEHLHMLAGGGYRRRHSICRTSTHPRSHSFHLPL